jgi:hypothetical protein
MPHDKKTEGAKTGHGQPSRDLARGHAVSSEALLSSPPGPSGRDGRLQVASNPAQRRARVGQAIKREIEMVGANVQAISREVAISRTAIHNVLEGRSQVTAVFAVRLAAALESRRSSPSEVPAIQRVRRRAIGFLSLGSKMDVDAVLLDPKTVEMVKRLRLADSDRQEA